MSKKFLIEIEDKIKSLWENGELPFLLHLSGGNEEQIIKIFSEIKAEDYVFCSHRAHYHYILKGASEETLIEKIRQNKSMFLFDKKLNFFTSSILAGTCGIAAGVALGFRLTNKTNKVWCFLGDGAEDEGHFYEAVRFVYNLDLPCQFVIEDNDLSVEVSKKQRGSSLNIRWPKCVTRYYYQRKYPHAGSGCKFQIKFKT